MAIAMPEKAVLPTTGSQVESPKMGVFHRLEDKFDTPQSGLKSLLQAVYHLSDLQPPPNTHRR